MPTTTTAACDRIRSHPDNPRQNLGDLDALADSIRAQGIIEPLVAAPDPDNTDGLLLLVGHRRLAAAVRAGLSEVPVIVRDDLDRAGQVETMLVENLQRRDLNPVETGDAYQALLDLPMPDGKKRTPAKLAKALGVTTDDVKQHTAAAKLPESDRDRVIGGQVTLEQAAALAEFEHDEWASAELHNALERGDRWHFESTLRGCRIRAERAREREANLRRAKKEGIPVVEHQGCASADDDAGRTVWRVDYLAQQLSRLKLDDRREGITSRAAADRAAIEEINEALEERKDARAFFSDGSEAIIDPASIWPEVADINAPKAAGPEEEEAEAARREEAEQRARDMEERRIALRAAAQTRRAQIGEHIRTPSSDKHARAALLDRFHPVTTDRSWFRNLRVLADVLLPDRDRTKDVDRLGARVSKALEKLSTHELVLVDILRTNAHCEVALEEQPHEWAYEPTGKRTDFPVAHWRRVLENTFAHEWTDAERAATTAAQEERW